MLLVHAAAVVAQTQPNSTPEDEYKRLIKVNEDIQPLGDTPFGERISLYDGSLSFEQTDISVPGARADDYYRARLPPAQCRRAHRL